MKLAGHKPRVISNLNHLNQIAINRAAGEN
jgi:hypothetical protein